jgi:transcriptional regulator with XRE-family HTH domain
MQDDLDKKAGAALRDIRAKLGRSQEDVSIDIDLDQSTLSKIERTGPAAVGWKRFCEVVNALGYEAEIVFRPTGKKP